MTTCPLRKLPLISRSAACPRTGRVLLEHFRIDSDHSNAFTLWKKMGSPQSPTSEQYQELQRAGQLQPLESPGWVPVSQAGAHLHLVLPRQGISLLRITWE